jgi:hypothetical protein
MPPMPQPKHTKPNSPKTQQQQQKQQHKPQPKKQAKMLKRKQRVLATNQTKMMEKTIMELISMPTLSQSKDPNTQMEIVKIDYQYHLFYYQLSYNHI